MIQPPRPRSAAPGMMDWAAMARSQPKELWISMLPKTMTYAAGP